MSQLMGVAIKTGRQSVQSQVAYTYMICMIKSGPDRDVINMCLARIVAVATSTQSAYEPSNERMV